MSLETAELGHIAWSQLWQVSVAVLAVGALVRLFCVHRSHLAYLLWLVVLIKCLTPPIWSSPTGVFSWVQAQIRLVNNTTRGVISAPVHPAPNVTADTSAGPASDSHSAQRESSVAADSGEGKREPTIAATTIIFAAWITGIVVVGFVTVVRWLGFKRAIQLTSISADQSLQNVFNEVARQLGVRQNVRLIVTTSSIGPVTCGVFRPVVIVPNALVTGDHRAHARSIFAHELAHVRRRDTVSAAMQLVAQSLWWFHPLIWWANRQISRQREYCCDEEVVARLSLAPGDYARCLLDVLALKLDLRPGHGLPAIDPYEVTSARLRKVMKKARRYHRRTPSWCWAVLSVAALIMLPGARLVIVRGGQPDLARSGGKRVKLLAEDGKPNDLFGQSVDVSGNLAIVGTGQWPGVVAESAYLFDARSGRQLIKLTAKDASEPIGFGHRVAIDGRTAVVAALAHRQRNATGAVYVFDTQTGQLRLKLTKSDAAGFGASVAIDGGLIIVGASGGIGQGTADGAAYVFDARTGEQIVKLVPEDPSKYDRFGGAVAVSGQTAVVGSFAKDGAGRESGAAYVFDVDTGRQRFKLIADDAGEADMFGYSVAIDGNVAIVGSPQFAILTRHGAGKAYLFDVSTGAPMNTLSLADGEDLDAFGFSVAIQGETAVVGAHQRGERNGGAVYLFDVASARQMGTLIPHDWSPGDHYGMSVNIRGDLVAVGSTSDDDLGVNAGSAYIFQLGGPSQE